jgi:hypothetical protein
MRRIRRGLKRLWRMSDPYYAAKDDGLVKFRSKLVTSQVATNYAQAAMRLMAEKEEEGDERFLDYPNDPSYDWVAETKRAREAKHAENR